ncbi:MAG: hypothetical protein EPO20_30515 [Betaproteobacteria bacterium]|nr:MAG: hypothetical protein EPO20_30515 [Betaproteobacteria bacterium]
MKWFVVLLATLLFSGIAFANYMADFNVSFGGSDEPPIIDAPPVEELPTITEISIQYVAEGDFRKYLIDPVKLTAYLYTGDFLTRDFYFYKAIEQENKLFNVSGVSAACGITIYQLNLSGNLVDATSTETDSLLGFNMGKGDEAYLAIIPTTEGTCRIVIDNIAYSVDFRRVDSAEQYIAKYKFPCGEGIFCITLPNGEQVNVTQWEGLGCSWDAMKAGNQACQDELTSNALKKVDDLNAQLADAVAKSNPEIAAKLDEVKGELKEVKKEQFDINGFFNQITIFGGLAFIVFVSVVGGALIIRQSRKPRISFEMRQYFTKADEVKKMLEEEEEKFAKLKEQKQEIENNGNTS